MFYLDEVKYKDLNRTSEMNTTDKLKKGAYSQGYEADIQTHPKYGSHSIVNLRHRKSGESVKKPDGREIGGKNPKGGKITDTTVINTMADAIRTDAKARGRVDKTPEGKAKRAKEAQANKATKKAKRAEPFGYKGKSLREFMELCEQYQAEYTYL
jgi:hypothetical protein